MGTTLKRRQFLSGAAATPLLLSQAGCGESLPTEPDPIEPPATEQTDPVPGSTTELTEVSEDLVAEFLLASLSESEALPTAERLGTDEVASIGELLADPALFANTKELITNAITGNLTAKAIEDEETVDYYHLVSSEAFGTDVAYSDTSFDLTADLLEAICAANAYPVADQDTVLFGLRGCSLADDSLSQSSGSTVSIRENQVDYWRFKCLIGIWERSTGNLQVFRASTVPNLVNMQTHIQDLAAGSPEAAELGITWRQRGVHCNLKPQGFHTMVVGLHNMSNADWRKRQPGALRQVNPFPILRAQHDMNYSFEASWDPLDWRPNMSQSDTVIRYVGDNIHAGINSNNPPFSSAGCHTIKGHYAPKGKTPQGDWAAFQSALGVEVIEDTPDEAYSSNLDLTTFRYLLTTGREARMHSIAQPDSEQSRALKRLRFGSTGPQVAALRRIIGVAGASDVFDGTTMNELLRWQSARVRQTDGVVSPALIANGLQALDW